MNREHMKIGIVGIGVVGGAVKYGMEKLGHDVKVHDLLLDTQLSDLVDCRVVYICVPTPEHDDGSCDTSIVEDIVGSLIHLYAFQGTIAIKSTVVPGTTERFIEQYTELKSIPLPMDNFGPHTLMGPAEMVVKQIKPKICFVPEFLRERHAISDFTENHDVCVIGTHNPDCFRDIKNSHGHYPDEVVCMTPTEAELSKYFSNVFNAMRVIFANGFYEVCKSLGADYTKIKNAVVKRPTMKNIYLDCNEKFRGYAGVCLPKDTAAFARLAEDLGVDAQIFRTIVEDNDLYVPTVFEDMRLK